MKASGEQWNELRATQSLKETAALVGGYLAWGVEIPNAESYHRRIVRAHDEQDVDAYQEALDGYLEAARVLYLKAQGMKL